MSGVFQHIRQTIRRGQVIDTPSGRSSFRIAKIPANGIELLAGKSREKICVTPAMFDAAVSHLKTKGDVLIGQVGRKHPGSLYDLFKGNGWSSRHASYIAAILEHK